MTMTASVTVESRISCQSLGTIVYSTSRRQERGLSGRATQTRPTASVVGNVLLTELLSSSHRRRHCVTLMTSSCPCHRHRRREVVVRS